MSARNGDDREPGTVTKAGTDLTIVIPIADNLTNNFILGGFQNDTKGDPYSEIQAQAYK